LTLRLKTKWLLVSVVGGVVIAGVLFVFAANASIDAVVGVPGPLGAVVDVVLWPVTACLYFPSLGPSIGSPEKHWHEGTPVQGFAAFTGIGLSWVFYSSVVFLTIWLQQRRRALHKTSAAR